MACILFILTTFLCSIKASAQIWLEDHLLADSIASKMKISQVTETEYSKNNFSHPSSTIIENFDNYGNRIKRTESKIDHQLVSVYDYDHFKSEIKITITKFNWWNRNDTVVTTRTEKYDLVKRYNKEQKIPLSILYPGKVKYNVAGQLIERFDTTENGYTKLINYYDEDGRVVEEKRSFTSNRYKSELSCTIRITYNEEGRKNTTVGVYTSSGLSPGEGITGKVETEFQYSQNGLLKEKKVSFSVVGEKEKPEYKLFKYEYKFLDF